MDYFLFVNVNKAVDYSVEERLNFRGEESTSDSEEFV